MDIVFQLKLYTCSVPLLFFLQPLSLSEKIYHKTLHCFESRLWLKCQIFLQLTLPLFELCLQAEEC